MSPKILIIEQGFIQQDAISFLQSLGYDIYFFLIDNNFSYKKSLQEFIEKPFFDIDPKSIGYYRIDNWLTRILRMVEQKSS